MDTIRHAQSAATHRTNTLSKHKRRQSSSSVHSQHADMSRSPATRLHSNISPHSIRQCEIHQCERVCSGGERECAIVAVSCVSESCVSESMVRVKSWSHARRAGHAACCVWVESVQRSHSCKEREAEFMRACNGQPREAAILLGPILASHVSTARATRPLTAHALPLLSRA